jgi:hypothetical protein
MENLLGVTNMTRKGDNMISFDLQDGLYALGVNPADRDYFHVNVREQLYRLAGLPKGWSMSPFYNKTTLTFVNFLRAPDPLLPCLEPIVCTTTYLKLTKRSANIPYVNDFLLFVTAEEEALTLQQRLSNPMDRLGLLRHPTKGFWQPTQVDHYPGIDIDTTSCYFYAP